MLEIIVHGQNSKHDFRSLFREGGIHFIVLPVVFLWNEV